MIEHRLALPQRSPKPLIVPCTWTAPCSTAVRRVGHGQLGVVVAMDAERTVDRRGAPRAVASAIVAGQGAAVGVAQHDAVAPPAAAARQAVAARSRDRPDSRRRSARRRRSPPRVLAADSSTESWIISRFSSREIRRTSRTWSCQVLPKMVMTGVSASTSLRRFGHRPPPCPPGASMPKAAIRACLSFSFLASRKNSSSAGSIPASRPRCSRSRARRVARRCAACPPA